MRITSPLTILLSAFSVTGFARPLTQGGSAAKANALWLEHELLPPPQSAGNYGLGVSHDTSRRKRSEFEAPGMIQTMTENLDMIAEWVSRGPNIEDGLDYYEKIQIIDDSVILLWTLMEITQKGVENFQAPQEERRRVWNTRTFNGLLLEWRGLMNDINKIPSFGTESLSNLRRGKERSTFLKQLFKKAYIKVLRYPE